jgi:RHS repeat-associated protein
MRFRALRKTNTWLFSILVVLLAAAAAEASFSPATGITYANQAAYASAAALVNSTGVTGLGAYVGAGACSAKANLFSQDVEYTVPLFSLVGRAGLNLSLALTYNSKVWIKSGSTMYFDGGQSWPAPGWRLGFGRIDGRYTDSSSVNHYYYIAPDGGIHDLPYNSTDSLYESTDSTYLDFNDSTGVLRSSDGTQTTFALQGGSGGYVLPTQVKDRNGNYITINYTGTGQQISSIVDSVGRTVSFSYTSGLLSSISKSGFGGASRTWSFSYTSLTLSTSFASSLTVNAPTSVEVLSSITFPNSMSQAFSYNGYGQLTEADMDSTSSAVRGKFLTSWESAPGGGWTTSPIPASIGNFDGTNTNTWSLSFGTYTTTVTDPTSMATTTTFINSGGWNDGLPSQRQIGSTALRTAANTWGNDSSSMNPRITQILTTLNDTGQESEIQTDYTSSGNPSEVREYDYGSGAVGSLLRKTDYTYETSTNYTNLHILNLPASKIIYNGSGTAVSNMSYSYDGSSLASATGASNHDDTNFGTGFTYRGLATSVTQYTNPISPSGAITHTKTYDMLGNMLTVTADCCIQQQYNYSSTTQYSEPDSVVRGSGTTLTTSMTYDSYTGLRASAEDPNNQTTSYNYDVMDRQTSITRPDSSVMTTTYDDSSANPARTVTTPITSTTSVKKTTTFDGLGRAIRLTMLDASSTVYAKTDTQYDGLGRTAQVSMPYTGSSASYWSQIQYDGLGRKTKAIPADGSSSSNNIVISYSGNATTTTDEAGNQREVKVDALGRQIETIEPDPTSSNSLTLTTTYTCDPIGNLTQVSQGSQTRTFVFDGLSRMTSQATPEAGTVSYAYNNYGKMTSRTDARGVVTTYTYDSTLNRLTGISYDVSGATGVPSTPSVSYTYGTSTSSYNNGRLITISDGLGSESFTYDQLGRQLQLQKTVYNVTYTTSQTYNLAGGVTTMTYPSGRVIKNNFDAIGRRAGIQNNSTSANYATSIGYNAANQVTGFTYGNGVEASYGYTAQRLQTSSIAYALGGSDLFSLSYSYTQSGDNDGEIVSITDNVDSGRSASYTYDALYRLTAASTTGSSDYPAWGLSFTYDRYGNRTAQSVTAGTAYADSPTISTSTNQVTAYGGSSFTYDANGNLTQDDQYEYVYDGENRMVTLKNLSGTTIATYGFDGHSMRIVKVWGGGRTFDIYAWSQLISEFEDAASNTYSSGTTPGGATSDSASTILYHHPDKLTTRLTTDNSGNLANEQGHFPYGEDWYSVGTANGSVARKFTTYQQDFEANNAMLHYAQARESSARLGRFQSTDPVRGRINNPQRLNRYIYVKGDPINHSDRRGRDDSPGDTGPCDEVVRARGMISANDDGLGVNDGCGPEPPAPCNQDGGDWVGGCGGGGGGGNPGDPVNPGDPGYPVGPGPVGPDPIGPVGPISGPVSGPVSGQDPCWSQMVSCLQNIWPALKGCLDVDGYAGAACMAGVVAACAFTGPGAPACIATGASGCAIGGGGFALGCIAGAQLNAEYCVLQYTACKATYWLFF